MKIKIDMNFTNTEFQMWFHTNNFTYNMMDILQIRTFSNGLYGSWGRRHNVKRFEKYRSPL